MDTFDELRVALIERIHVPDEPCWIWRGYLNKKGYGILRLHGHARFAHRVAYEALVGPIPDNHEIHHKCWNRSCVNPAHLEAVTHAVNLRESHCVSAINAAKTHCINGHEFTPENTYVSNRGRQCRECRRKASREANRQRRGYYERDRENCKNGHPKTPENRGVDRRGRSYCKACKREENMRYRRAAGVPVKGIPKTHCIRGHAYTPENTYRYANGNYYCKTCSRDRAREKHRAARAG